MVKSTETCPRPQEEDGRQEGAGAGERKREKEREQESWERREMGQRHRVWSQRSANLKERAGVT